MGAALLCPSRFPLSRSLFRWVPWPQICIHSLLRDVHCTGPSLMLQAVSPRTKNTMDLNRIKTRALQSCPIPAPFRPGQLLRHHRGKLGLGDTTQPCAPFLKRQSDLPLSREGVAEPGMTQSPHQALFILLSPFLVTQTHGSLHVRTGLPSEAVCAHGFAFAEPAYFSDVQDHVFSCLKRPQIPKLYLSKRTVSKS